MKKTKTMAYALAFLMSFSLLGCNTGEERMENPMQEESTEPTMRREADSRGVEPGTHLDPLSPGENGADLSETDPNIGGYEMMPSQNLVENITSNVNLTTFASVIRKAEFVDALNATGPHTVFAPMNEAFEGLPENTLEDLMKPENREQLVALLNNHVVAGQLKAEQLQDGSTLKTLGGTQLKVTKEGNRLTVNGAEVMEPNALSQNGVIHVINKVMSVNE